MSSESDETAYDFIDRVQSTMPRLSPAKKLIAQRLIEFELKVGFKGIHEFSRECGTSACEVVRFAQYFGYSGFKPIKKKFKDALRQQLPPKASLKRVFKAKTHA